MLSTICAVPVSVNGQDARPGSAAVPFTVYGTELPLIWPEAVPLPEMPFAHVAENVPAIALDVWLVTCHENPVQLLAARPAIGFDDHVPSIVGTAVAAADPVADSEVELGARMPLESRSKPVHALVAIARRRTEQRSRMIVALMCTVRRHVPCNSHYKTRTGAPDL